MLKRHAGDSVLVREGAVLAASFHPELTVDIAIHQYFCTMAHGEAASPAIPSTIAPPR